MDTIMNIEWVAANLLFETRDLTAKRLEREPLAVISTIIISALAAEQQM